MDYKEEIKKAAEKYYPDGLTEDTSIRESFQISFTNGATSQAAKDYWLDYFSNILETKDDSEDLSLIDIVSSAIKCEAAREYWKDY